jgi:hypothetical protein
VRPARGRCHFAPPAQPPYDCLPIPLVPPITRARLPAHSVGSNENRVAPVMATRKFCRHLVSSPFRAERADAPRDPSQVRGWSEAGRTARAGETTVRSSGPDDRPPQ